MHIEVSDILAQSIGYRTGFEIAGEHPEIEDVTLLDDINGNVDLTRVENGLLLGGKISTSMELECHRCLRAFAYPLEVKLTGEFAATPEPDQWPIEADGVIDLAPPIRQELIVNIPIKQLCKADCLGLCTVCGQPQDEPHEH
jgi:uncharacterized protein